MAQALFDQHPLEQYLQNAGEVRDLCPGTTLDLEYELDPSRGTDLEEEDDNSDAMESCPTIIVNILEAIASAISVLRPANRPSPFVERFKYSVISSSLLAVALPSSHGRTPRSSIPGQLDHSRTPSLEAHRITPPTSTPVPDSSYLIPSLSLIFAAVFFHAGHIFLALASLGTTVYTLVPANEISKHDMSSSLESLKELVDASDTWESLVQEAVSFLENDERSAFDSSSPTSSTSSIRAALHSTLLTTQSQCDNVRQLFSALTSPTELSQLSEMYAPPSPIAQSFSHDRNTRPLSLPVRRRTLSMPSDPFQTIKSKRQTWSGSHTKSRQLGGPSNLFLQRREKRRSDLSSLLQMDDKHILKTASAPVTPSPAPLPFVTEEMGPDVEEMEDSAPFPRSADASEHFGAAALALRREQKTAGMNTFGPTSPNHFSPTSASPPHPRTPQTPNKPTSPLGTRYTPIQPTRHPFSLSALNFALQSALASKRYASSHLLALRFAEEEDDEGYWEDVRSVMGLLSSALVDASARLSEALIEVEQQRLRDQNPTPCLSFEGGSDKSLDGSDLSLASLSPLSKTTRRSTSISFAPIPSDLARFAGHVEAIVSALDDAKENLQECVAALREEMGVSGSESNSGSAQQLPRRRRPVSGSPVEPHASSPALDAYERMRRELGMALRECERGRERLLDAVFPSTDLNDMEEGEDDLPALGHDGSEDSDKPDHLTPSDDEIEQQVHLDSVVAVDTGNEASTLDDATAHLLIATSAKHLPPPGIEQVFEADSADVGVFTRERSKLTREERIKLAKARREGASGLHIQSDLSIKTASGRGVEKWGPGGEVVQELKDVIWKVGERRRKMAESLDRTSKIHPV